MVGEAMGIFERLELWDSLLVCYQLLNKNAEAISLIQTRLKVTHWQCLMFTKMKLPNVLQQKSASFLACLN